MTQCPKCQSDKQIGIEISVAYDGVLFWRCEECGTNYHRFPEEFTGLRAKAEKYIKEIDNDGLSTAGAGSA